MRRRIDSASLHRSGGAGCRTSSRSSAPSDAKPATPRNVRRSLRRGRSSCRLPIVSDAMLTETLFRIPRRDGLQLLQRRDGALARELTSWRLHLSPGASQTYRAPGEETIVVLQEGKGRFAVGESTWDVRRANVFDERATALYLPPGRELTVRADSVLE